MGRVDPKVLDAIFEGDVVSGAWDAPDLHLLGDQSAPPPPLPLSAFGPFWARWLEKYSRAMTTPIDYAVAGLFGLAAACMGASRAARAKQGWIEYPALWLVVVGTPSAGKTPSLSPFVSIIRKVEKRLGDGYQEALLKWETQKFVAEQAAKAWEADTAARVKDKGSILIKPAEAIVPEKPGPPRILVTDVTVEALAPLFRANPRGLLLHSDELGTWIGNVDKYGGSGNVPWFLSRWSGEPLTVDRRHAEPIHAQRGLLSVLGGIQPGVLADYLRQADSGFVARLVLFAPATRPMTWTDNTTDLQPVELAAERLVGLRMEGENADQPKELQLNGYALARWEAWYNDVQRRAHLTPEGHLHGVLSKGGSTVLRLALLIEYLHWSATDEPEPEAITDASLTGAISLFDEYLVPMYARALGLAARGRDAMTAGAVLVHARAKGLTMINQRELGRTGGFDPKVLPAALALLEAGGWIRNAASRAGNTEGRKRKDFEVNPRLFEP